MRIDVFTIFPEYFSVLDISLVGKARERGLLEVHTHDLRDHAHDRHRTVDDTPYGGGAGMVMKAQPWAEALTSALPEGGLTPSGQRPLLLVPSPAGRVFDQATAQEWSEREHLLFACGRYEGIDERVIDWAQDRAEVVPFSLGDYVLNGGEVASLAIIEAVGRLIPGMVGNPASLVEESHSDGLLEYPVYTKPASWEGLDVPAVLLSGDHGKVDRQRRDWQLERTSARRPDLIERLEVSGLDKKDKATLGALGWRLDGPTPRRA
ncbi:MAG: tRNA (guanosine(37)-N1)-methyltransferase TrmD [Arthrobacter sp.]|jgi:tRNA (guanine37-N1)-methyltransferase|nr:tRNA (guanosine(37)-N1)-methyltransferase TrmD [Arthrobacter sp.]